MLNNTGHVLGQVVQVEGGGVARGGCLQTHATDEGGRLRGKAEALEGTVNKCGEIDVLAVPRQKAVVGKGVQARARRPDVGVCRELEGVCGLVEEGVGERCQGGDGREARGFKGRHFLLELLLFCVNSKRTTTADIRLVGEAW